VSPDTVIAIVFGLVGVILSLAGVIIACLTLRLMILEKCMLPLLLLPSSLLAIVYLVSILTSYIMQDERHRPMDRDYCESLLRHEHTHLFPLPQEQGARQRTLKPV
jgi:H+/Cl- antiporter ClcA